MSEVDSQDPAKCSSQTAEIEFLTRLAHPKTVPEPDPILTHPRFHRRASSSLSRQARLRKDYDRG